MIHVLARQDDITNKESIHCTNPYICRNLSLLHQYIQSDFSLLLIHTVSPNTKFKRIASEILPLNVPRISLRISVHIRSIKLNYSKLSQNNIFRIIHFHRNKRIRMSSYKRFLVNRNFEINFNENRKFGASEKHSVILRTVISGYKIPPTILDITDKIHFLF